MKSSENKKIYFYLLILICVFQLFVSIFWANKKCYLYTDELFSYVSANNVGYTGEIPENKWENERWYTDYVSVQPEYRFDYSIPYDNQTKDVHPPLFYIILHTACSLIPDEFSFWTGTGINILFFIGSTIFLYYLSVTILKSRKISLLIAFLYSFSFGGLNTMVFIRMYMLLTFAVLFHVFCYMRYLEEENVSLKGYLLLGISFIAGMMTQYYFSVIAFFLALWYGIKFLHSKQYKKAGKYVLTLGVSSFVSILLYPAMLHHIFDTGRGVEARENFISSEGYLEKLKMMWKHLDSQMFTNLLSIILFLLLILSVFYFLKEKSIPKQLLSKLGAILFCCIGYFLVVTKIAPYQIDRYLMPIYPLVYLLVIGIACKLLYKIFSIKLTAALCLCVFGGLSVIHMIHSGIPYTYENDLVITPRIELTDNHKDSYAIYIGEKEEAYCYYEVIQVLKEYKGFYNINDLSNVSQISKDMRILKDESNIILYVNKNFNDRLEEIFSLIEQILPGFEANRDCLIQSDVIWDVYLVKSSSPSMKRNGKF